MTTDMKLKMLKSMTDEEDKDVLSTYLSLAEKAVLRKVNRTLTTLTILIILPRTRVLIVTV